MADVLISGVRLVTPDALPQDVDILIQSGVIAAVAAGGTITADFPRIEASGFIALPGLVNAHTHSHNALSRGLGDAWTLELLLNYGPALNARRTPEDHYWAAMLNGLEMLKCGATSAFDLVIHAPAPTVESMHAVMRAYDDLGIRAIVAPAVADLPFFSIVPGLLDSLPDDLRRDVDRLLPVPGAELLVRQQQILKELQPSSRSDRVRLALAPTIPAQCSDEFLRGCIQTSAEFDVGIHTHLAESRVQAVEGLRRYGTSLTQHLHEIGMLGPRFVAAHAVWLDDRDAQLLADSGATVAHNPGSNLKLGSGIAPVRMFLDAQINVAIGTDGSASSDNQNMFEAARLASLVSRVRSVDPGEWLDAPTTLSCAVYGGAGACSALGITGTIAAGNPADLVLLRRDSVFLQPENDLRVQLIHAETAAAVDTVIVAGEVVLRDGRSTRVDESRVYRESQAAINRVLSTNVAEWEFARRLSPYIVKTCSALAATPLPINRLTTGP